MAKSIEYYTAEVSKSYDNSRKALQNQINAIEGNLAKAKAQINENYAQQQNTLNNQRNQAASNASMQAAGSGGSFGGAANIANKKYYEQQFIPAQTQLNTNQSHALENAQSQADSNRLSLESQMANLKDEIARQGLARYYDVLDKERQERLQRQAIAAQNRANSYIGQGGNSSSGNGGMQWDFGNGYSIVGTKGGEAIYRKNGKTITAGEFLNGTTGKNTNWNAWKDIWNSDVRTNGVGADTIANWSKARSFWGW